MERKGDSQTLQTKFLLNVSWMISCSAADGASSLAFRSSLSSSSCLKDIMGREVSRLSPEETTDDTAERGGGEGEEEEEEDEKEEEEEEEEEEDDDEEEEEELELELLERLFRLAGAGS